MTAGTDSVSDHPYVAALGRVRQVTLPPAARALSTLPHVDYEDAFLVETGRAQDRTAEQWARAILEDAPVSMRNALSRGWSTLGLRVGSTDPDRFVLGWELRRSTPDVALLGARGRLGLSGELLFERQQHTLLFATFVQLENAIARALWTGIASRHRQVVRDLLEQASDQERAGCRGSLTRPERRSRSGPRSTDAPRRYPGPARRRPVIRRPPAPGCWNLT